MIKKIIWTKKAILLQRDNNVYVFLVSVNLNKFQIKQELIDLFPNIQIKKIRTCRYKQVMLSPMKMRKLPGKHYTKPIKKAFVELVPGFNFDTSHEDNLLLNANNDTKEVVIK